MNSVSGRFSQRHDDPGQNEETKHAEDFSLIFSPEGMIRRQKPIPHSDHSDRDGNDGRANPAIPCGESDCQPNSVIGILLSNQWIEQPAQVQSCHSSSDCERITRCVSLDPAHDSTLTLNGWY